MRTGIEIKNREKAAGMIKAMNVLAWAISDEDAMGLWLTDGFEEPDAATDEEIEDFAATATDDEIQHVFDVFALCAKRAAADGCHLAFWCE